MRRCYIIYGFEKVGEAKITKIFGEDFCNKVKKLTLQSINVDMEELSLMQSFSANLVFKGYSKIYGPVVIKFGRDYGEISSEVAML